jgi:invasion protein IalB
MKKIIMMSAMMLALLTGNGFSADKTSEPEVKVTNEQKFGKWNYRCEALAGQGESTGCGATQVFSVEDKETKKKSALFTIDLMADAKTKQPVFRLRTPLGTLLPQGISMIVDKKEVQKFPLLMCLPSVLGCYTMVNSKDAVDTAMRNNKVVRFGFVIGKEPFAVDVETSGYADIVSKLKS